MATDYVLIWVAVGLYGLSAFLYIIGFIARSEKLFLAGLVLALAGFAPHTVSIILRWTSTGISPFFTTGESLTFGAFVTLLLFAIHQLATRKLRPLGVLVVPVTFVLLAWSGTLYEDAATQIAPALQSGWIWAHIISASSGFAAVLVAAAIGLMYLLRERYSGGIYEKFPELKTLDQQSYRFVLGGFVLYGLMIVSGCFWAYQVKGDYWAWDPVEVWSLISWLTYGIYLHLRISLGWRGKRMAWFALLAMLAMIVSYWGVPFTMETFHSGFRVEH